jgi:hypothetical protein
LSIPSVLGLLALSPETVSPSSASVGDCVDRDGRWTATDLREASCSQEHDAEVVYQGRFDAKLVRALRHTRPAQLCRRLLPRKVGRAVVDGSARLRLVVESRSPARPKRDDAFVCLAVGSGDGQLYGPLLGSRGASGHVAHA